MSLYEFVEQVVTLPLESLEIIQLVVKTDTIIQSLNISVHEETAYNSIPERFRPILVQIGITRSLQDIWILFGNALIAVAGNERVIQSGESLFFQLRQHGFISFNLSNGSIVEFKEFNLPQMINKKYNYCLKDKSIYIEHPLFAYSICDHDSAASINNRWFEESSSVVSEVCLY